MEQKSDYIHKNPVHHGYINSIDQWKWSSYQSLISQKPTQVERHQVLDWFGGLDRFIEFHQQPIYLKDVKYKVPEKIIKFEGAAAFRNL